MSAAFAVRPSVFGFCSDLSNVFPNLRSPSKLSPSFRRFSLFDRIFRVFADSLPQSRRSGLFKRVFRRFTSLYAPLKKIPCPALKLRFKLFSARTESFLLNGLFRVLKVIRAIYRVTLAAPPTHSDAQNVLSLSICRITRFCARCTLPLQKVFPTDFTPFSAP